VDLDLKQIELASRTDPSVIDRGQILDLIGDGPWVVRMLLLRMIARVEWVGSEREAVRSFVVSQMSDSNTFVRAWSLDAAASLASGDEELTLVTNRAIAEALGGGPPSIRVRARAAASRLAGS